MPLLVIRLLFSEKYKPHRGSSQTTVLHAWWRTVLRRCTERLVAPTTFQLQQLCYWLFFSVCTRRDLFFIVTSSGCDRSAVKNDDHLGPSLAPSIVSAGLEAPDWSHLAGNQELRWELMR